MKTEPNLNNFSNNASKFHKYSNYTLFSRRETEYSSRIKKKSATNINSSFQRPYSTSIKKISLMNLKKSNNELFNPNIPNIFSSNQSKFSNNSSKSRVTLKTRIHVEDYFHKKNKSKTNQVNILESIINLEKYYSPNTSFINKYSKSKTNLNINTFFNDLNYINKIYLTEENIKKPIIKKDNNEEFDNFNFKDYNRKIYRDFTKNQNADILKKFKNDKFNYDIGEVLKSEYNERIINTKRKRINLCRKNKDEFMENLRNEKYDKLSLNSKKELRIRIQEIYQNKLEYLDDRIESFETWKKLNRDFFENKIGDYLKFLMYKKAFEKNKVEGLLEEIIKIKKELNKIYSKIAKIEVEKNKILRWVYFQIKLKEKKTILPEHYEKILENINLIDKYYEFKKEKSLESIQNNNLSKSINIQKKNVNNLNRSIISLNKSIYTPSPKKRDRQKKLNKKSSVPVKSDKEDSILKIKLNSELTTFLNTKEGKNEYLRIKKYKNNLIYKTVEEFNDRLLSIEREDLRLIEYNDFIKDKIFWFKKELDKATEEKNKMNAIFNYNLQINLNEINQLKLSYNVMQGIIQNLKNKKYFYKSNSKENNKKRNKSASILSKKIKNKIADKKMVYTKINKIFNLCKLVKFKNKKDYEILDEKRKLLKNEEILYFFVYIEYTFNYLLKEMNEFKNYNKNGEKAIKKILFDIERSHRMKKAEDMRKQLREKYIKLEYEINKKNNKIYILPYRKVRNVVKIKKGRLLIKDKGNEQPNFEDFIDNENDYKDFEEEKN